MTKLSTVSFLEVISFIYQRKCSFDSYNIEWFYILAKKKNELAKEIISKKLAIYK